MSTARYTIIKNAKGFAIGRVDYMKGGFWRASKVSDWRRGVSVMPPFFSFEDAVAWVRS